MHASKLRALLGPVLWALVTSCGAAPIEIPEGMSPHIGESWYAHRASQLEISVEMSKVRDESMSTQVPPDSLDLNTRIEAALIWDQACASCHGKSGDPSTAAVKLDPPPRDWSGFGPTMGFIFGGDKMRAGIFKRIAEGGEPGEDGRTSPMPAWSSQLSKEQIWALVEHIESL